MSKSQKQVDFKVSKKQVRIQDLVGGGTNLPMTRSTGVRGGRGRGRGPGPTLGPWKLLYF